MNRSVWISVATLLASGSAWAGCLDGGCGRIDWTEVTKDGAAGPIAAKLHGGFAWESSNGWSDGHPIGGSVVGFVHLTCADSGDQSGCIATLEKQIALAGTDGEFRFGGQFYDMQAGKVLTPEFLYSDEALSSTPFDLEAAFLGASSFNAKTCTTAFALPESEPGSDGGTTDGSDGLDADGSDGTVDGSDFSDVGSDGTDDGSGTDMGSDAMDDGTDFQDVGADFQDVGADFSDTSGDATDSGTSDAADEGFDLSDATDGGSTDATDADDGADAMDADDDGSEGLDDGGSTSPDASDGADGADADDGADGGASGVDVSDDGAGSDADDGGGAGSDAADDGSADDSADAADAVGDGGDDAGATSDGTDGTKKSTSATTKCDASGGRSGLSLGLMLAFAGFFLALRRQRV